MPYYTFVQDRESLIWRRGKDPERYDSEEYKGSRRVKVRRQYSILFPKPTEISAFIKEYKVIKAETEEEAWQMLKSK